MVRLQFLTGGRVAILLALAALVAGGATAPASATPLSDPVGDALCNLSSGGSCAVPYDITSVDAVTGGGKIEFIVHLNQNIALIPSQVPNPDPTDLWRSQFGGYIDIDTDQNPATGTFAWGDYFDQMLPGPPKVSGLGDEYYIDLYSEWDQPGMVDVWNGPGTAFQGTAPIVYGPDWFQVVVPLTLLGNDDGLLNYDVVVGDGTGLTDQAPDYQAVQAGSPPAASSIPEPPPVAFLGLAIACIGFMRRRAGAS